MQKDLYDFKGKQAPKALENRQAIIDFFNKNPDKKYTRSQLVIFTNVYARGIINHCEQLTQLGFLIKSIKRKKTVMYQKNREFK